MKKILVALLSFLMVFSVASCENSNSLSEAEKQEAAKAVSDYINDISKDDVVATMIQGGVNVILPLVVADPDVSALIGAVSGGSLDASLLSNIRNLVNKLEDPAYLEENLSGVINTSAGSEPVTEYEFAVTDVVFPAEIDTFLFDVIEGITEEHYTEETKGDLENLDDTKNPFNYPISIEGTVECINPTEHSIFRDETTKYNGSFDVTLNARVVNSNPHGDIYFKIDDVIISSPSIEITKGDATTPDVISFDDVTLALNWCIGKTFPVTAENGDVYLDLSALVDGDFSGLSFVPESGSVTYNGVPFPFLDVIGNLD